jgi:hypothetical protein
MNGSDIKNLMSSLDILLKKAYEIKEEKSYANIVTIDNKDYLLNMGIKNFITRFGEKTIQEVQEIVTSYSAVDSLIEHCYASHYDQARMIILQFPRLCKDIAFNQYIMIRLSSHKKKDCWKMLLESGFDCNIVNPLFGPFLNYVASAQNSAALYFLIYHGARYQATNTRDKSCLDLLSTQLLQIEQKEKAKECLLAIQKACRNRTQKLRENNQFNTAEVAHLVSTEDFISRVIKYK